MTGRWGYLFKELFIILKFIIQLLETAILVVLDIIHSWKKRLWRVEQEFVNETVLITGSDGGVGRQLCIQFAIRGCNLICLENHDKKPSMENFIKHILSKINRSIRISTYYYDLNDIENIDAFFNNILSCCKVSIVVMNAATRKGEDFDNLDVDNFKQVINVNFISNAILLKCVLPYMLKEKYGKVIAISSILAKYGLEYEVAYCASKCALASLIESAREYCDRIEPNSIKFHTLFPAKIDTPLFSHINIKAPINYLVPLLTPEFVAYSVIKAISCDQKEIYLPTFASKIFLLIRQIVPTESTLRIIRLLFPSLQPYTISCKQQ